MEIVKINKVLQDVKDSSWVGVVSNDTDEIDYVKNSLKLLLDSDELEDKDKVVVLKELRQLERDRVDKAKHLDFMLLKKYEIDKTSNFTGDNKKEVKSLWQKEK